MGFQQALSGLNAATRGLEVIGNNIANVNTIGAKSSRAEFTDCYATSLTSTMGSAAAPAGVRVATIAQSFTQGNVSLTGNDLDLALNGSGFFQVTAIDGSTAYTRNGEFKMDKNGYVVTNGGAKLMGYATDITGKRTDTTAAPIQLPTANTVLPKVTSAVNARINLDARTAYNKDAPLTQISTTLITYDPQGVEVPVSLYFVKTDKANTWDVQASIGGSKPEKVGGLVFDASGNLKETLDDKGAPTGKSLLELTVPEPEAATTPPATPPAADATTPDKPEPRKFTVDFAKSTQLGSAFSVNNLTQDGWAPGELNGIKIGTDGIITARYSNGQQQALGQVMVAGFTNPQGLSPIGGSMWVETAASGAAKRGSPGESGLGTVQSGALEESNIDLTAELVSMMNVQRSYQANAQTIKTLDSVMSTLLNMR